jgi:hypothetical protein
MLQADEQTNYHALLRRCLFMIKLNLYFEIES